MTATEIPAITLVLAVLGLLVIVVLTRCAFLLLPESRQPGASVQRALGYAPLAALAALVAPDGWSWLASEAARTLAVDGAWWAVLTGALHDGRLPALVLTVVASWWRRSAFVGLLAGAGLFGLLQL